MTVADDKKKKEDLIKKVEIVGAGVVGLAAGVIATGAAAMALDPKLKDKLEDKVEDLTSGIGEKRDELVEKVDEAKKQVAKKLE